MILLVVVIGLGLVIGFGATGCLVVVCFWRLKMGSVVGGVVMLVIMVECLMSFRCLLVWGVVLGLRNVVVCL